MTLIQQIVGQNASAFSVMQRKRGCKRGIILVQEDQRRFLHDLVIDLVIIRDHRRIDRLQQNARRLCRQQITEQLALVIIIVIAEHHVQQIALARQIFRSAAHDLRKDVKLRAAQHNADQLVCRCCRLGFFGCKLLCPFGNVGTAALDPVQIAFLLQHEHRLPHRAAAERELLRQIRFCRYFLSGKKCAILQLVFQPVG